MLNVRTGFDGGQRQWFAMEIFDQQTGMLQANVSSSSPLFDVNGLDAGRLLTIRIFSANIRGRSEPVVLEAFTLKVAEKQTGKSQSEYKYRFQQTANCTD